ncbi:MAG: hypothetical protein LIP02_00260 [Bacteroidales bacterium]|nr:hypothetical protein [Bacteroidales bacterium]
MKSTTAISCLCALTAFCAFAAPKDSKNNKDAESTAPKIRTEYNYRHKVTPEDLHLGGQMLLTHADKNVNTMTGDLLGNPGKPIVDMAINPSVINYVIIVDKGKGKTQSLVYSCVEDKELGKVEEKWGKAKYGPSRSVAYSPDARRFYLATDTALRVMNFNKYFQEGSMPVSWAPKHMTVSSNGYFLLGFRGDSVAVYNLNDRSLRKDWKFGEKVNDAAFSPDVQKLAIATDDGMVSVYDTRTFIVSQTLEDLGQALNLTWTPDNKYLAVLTAPNTIKIINTLDPTDDPDVIDIPEGGTTCVLFSEDSYSRPVLNFNREGGMRAKRLPQLLPNYGKLVTDRANERLAEWMKMMPGESMEAYALRVNDESRLAKLREFEDEEATALAGDMLSMADISLGLYDRDNSLLQVNFSNMPAVMLPVDESDLGSIHSADDLNFTNARYAVLPTDKFMLIYAQVQNRNNGATYTYANLDRLPLNYASTGSNFVPIEFIQQQQMEEMRLQELRAQIVAEAKQQNYISDHTNITVDASLEPDYDANGNKIINYLINFTYDVDPEFSSSEDFAPGKYHAEQSGAASAMLRLIKETFEGDFAKYLEPGKRMTVRISGSADGTPIVGRIVYDGAYGEFDNEPITSNGRMTSVTVMPNQLVKENEQLAFLRAAGVKTYINNEVGNLKAMNPEFNYNIDVLEGKGSDLRRIKAEFKIYDVYANQ